MLRTIDSCITQLKAQECLRTCNESKEEEENLGQGRKARLAQVGVPQSGQKQREFACTIYRHPGQIAHIPRYVGQGCEVGSLTKAYLKFVDSCITQLKAQGPSRTCNESKGHEGEEDLGQGRDVRLVKVGVPQLAARIPRLKARISRLKARIPLPKARIPQLRARE